MKVNKEKLQELAGKGDAELWTQIRAIAASHGYTMPENAPSHDDMQKIRAAMLGVEKINLTDAIKIINTCKKKR